MVRTVILEDEAHNIREIESCLKNYNHIDLIGSATSVSESVSTLNAYSPDLVLADIELLDGSVFDVLEQVGGLNFKVIFITAHDHYAIKAIKYSAIDYLLKPIDPEELNEALGKVKVDDFHGLEMKIQNLLDNFGGRKDESEQKIALPISTGYKLVKLKDIVRCEADTAYTDVVLTTGEKITISKNLNWLEELLSSQLFMRVHRSHLINTVHVNRYIRGDGGIAVMNDNSEIPVAKRKKEQLLSIIKTWR